MAAEGKTHKTNKSWVEQMPEKPAAGGIFHKKNELDSVGPKSWLSQLALFEF